MPDRPLDEIMERISWFSKMDYEILSFYEDHDILIAPKSLSRNIEYERSYVGRHLRKLRDAGLLCQEGADYGLTEVGRDFLQGDIGPDEIEELDPTDD